MKQNKLFRGTLSQVKVFLSAAVLTFAALTANAQTPTRVGITGVSEVNTFLTEKVYDGTTTLPMVTGATITLTGVNPGDDVEATPVGNYASANVDSNISYSISFTLTGTDAANYYIDTVVTGTNGRITPMQLTVTGTALILNKVYNGSRICPVLNQGTFSGMISGDDVTPTASATFADAGVGTNKRVTVVYSVGGADAGNYTAPRSDSSFFGDITPKPIHITGIAIDTAKIYDGTTTAQVINHGMPVFTEVLPFDTVMPVTATATYPDANVGVDKPIVVTYTLNGPQASNYTAYNDSTLVADIIGRPLTVSGAVVQICKEYDGNADALVLVGDTATNLVEGDVVPLVTTAFYDTPDTGHNKTIYLTFAFAAGGADQLNYTLPDTIEYSHVGKIIYPTQLDENGLFITTDGTCQGDNAAVNYTIAEGEPVAYYIAFAPEALAVGFTNADSVALPSTPTGFLPILVPDGCPFGHYTCNITFVNEAGGQASFPFAFTVNYSKDYITDIFEDVVSIVNVEELFTTYQWYHNGVAIDGATEPYYQEEGGLTGTYYVLVNAGTATEGRTCEKTFNNATAKTVKVRPNPVTSAAKVSLHGFGEGEHLLVVFNAYGQQVMQRTFEGNESNINFTAMPQGTYLVTVDGEKAKVVKY